MISFWARPKPGRWLCLLKEVFWGWRKVLTWVLETAFPISQREQIPEFLQGFGSLCSLLSWLDCYRLLADGRGLSSPSASFACLWLCLCWDHAGCQGKKLGSVVQTHPTDLICGFWLGFFSLSFFSSCGWIRVFQNWLTRGQRTGMQRAQQRLPNQQTHQGKGENTPSLCHRGQHLRRRAHVISGLHCRLNPSLHLASDLNFKPQPKHNLNLSTGYWFVSSPAPHMCSHSTEAEMCFPCQEPLVSKQLHQPGEWWSFHQLL